MQVVDAQRFFTACPELAERVQKCRLPGLYLWEYLSYTFSDDGIMSRTVYFHEPEWMDDSRSKDQRVSVLEYLRSTGCACDEVLRPDGKLIRIDPSFKSSDKSDILRLEMFFNSGDVVRQKSYMRSVAKWMCSDGKLDSIESLMSNCPAYHCAVAFDLGARRPVASRFYFRLPKETGREFVGMTLAETGKILSRKVYWRPSKEELEGCDVPVPDGFVPAYVAAEDTPSGRARKVYFFNELWNRQKGT